MNSRTERGFSLVELMVGMVLGLILIGGAVSIYLASKRSYVEVEQVAALTESARFAEQIIGDSLRHAGFFGGVSVGMIEASSSLTAVPSAQDCNDTGLTGGTDLASANNLGQFVFAGTVDSSNSALGCITGSGVEGGMEGTDVLVIKRVLTQPYTDGPRDSLDPNDPTQGDGTIDTPDSLDNNKTYVMTNNVKGLVFDGDSPPDISLGGEIPGGMAWEYNYEVYYIRDPDPTSTDDTPQLSRKTLKWNGTAMELQREDVAEGVENLRVLLGYSSNADGEVDTYKTPSQMAAADWVKVQSVEVFLLTRSATRDVQYTDVKQYQMPGTAIPVANDNYRRLISHASVSLRNLKLMARGGV
ncbi:MAG: PilW family protein [Pseudomonadota bacterium]